jgi:asparagine synthase (glutamine-hydrolysing)
MCGIAGFALKSDRLALEKWPAVLSQMGKAIFERGPDDSGFWVDEASGIGLAHRRLSILDLSKAGHQPMVSKSGRYVIVFNGEIYNHVQLRRRLGSKIGGWRGHSDTETLLEAIDAWGVETTLKETIGMFALALFERSTQILTLARDRIGEKPLYYGWCGKDFIFASQLKALSAYPYFAQEIDRDSLALLLRHNYIPSPYSIYQGIKKLPPCSFAQLDIGRCKEGEWPEPRNYWSLRDIAEQGQDFPLECSEQEAIKALDDLLRTAVGRQMVADVPLGAFLSGGVDSSTVVALMQAQSQRPVKTFTIGFHEPAYDEAIHARAVANHLGTDHTELYVTSSKALELIPQLPAIFDEPFSDPSQIPTMLVSQLAHKHVTVSLSGDAGDELFGGYNNYKRAIRNWQAFAWLPQLARGWMSRTLEKMPAPLWKSILGSRDKQSLAGLLGCPTREASYHYQVSHWKNPAQIAINSREPVTALTDPGRWAKLGPFQLHMMYVDMDSYLPDCILVKVDRAAMAVSLETRIPFLDQNVVEFAWRLPLSMKIRPKGQGKWILRQVLYRYLPQSLVERPKMGFGVPIDSWLRGPLREWAESLLMEKRLEQEGFFWPAPVRKKWQEHLSSTKDWANCLWNVLMFEQWLESTKRATSAFTQGQQLLPEECGRGTSCGLA